MAKLILPKQPFEERQKLFLKDLDEIGTKHKLSLGLTIRPLEVTIKDVKHTAYLPVYTFNDLESKDEPSPN